MNILVTGANGQLGSEIRKISPNYAEYSFTFTDVNELDLSKPEQIGVFFKKNRPNLVINCAAYTSVDNAETEVELAEMINVKAVKHLAESCKQSGSKLIHVSTDYVFDGTHYRPYTEEEMTSPNSVYGKTKLEGEEALKRILPEAIIIRTSWLYSSFGNNFVKTILRLSQERNELNVVVDQIGSPTYAFDLATAIYAVIKNFEESGSFKSGIYHFSDEGVCSWYDFALKIVETANHNCKLIPVGTHKFPRPAQRPYYSVLSKAKIKETFQIEIPHWEASLKKCLKVLNEET